MGFWIWVVLSLMLCSLVHTASIRNYLVNCTFKETCLFHLFNFKFHLVCETITIYLKLLPPLLLRDYAGINNRAVYGQLFFL